MTLTKERPRNRIEEAKPKFRTVKQYHEQRPRASEQTQVEEIPEREDFAGIEDNERDQDASTRAVSTSPKAVQGSLHIKVGTPARRHVRLDRQKISWKGRIRPTRGTPSQRLARDHWVSLPGGEKPNVAATEGIPGDALYDPDAMNRLLAALRDVSAIDDIEGLVNHLKAAGQPSVSRELQQYAEDLAKDPDEPPVSVESVRSLVAFVIAFPQITLPFVTSNRDGLLGLEWHIESEEGPKYGWEYGRGIVTLIFRDSGIVRFIALCLPMYEDQECPQAQGESKREHVFGSLGEFAQMITRA